MKIGRVVAASLGVWFCTVAASAQDGRRAAPSRPAPALAGIVEVVPTARRERVAWRYTFDRPRGDWTRPGFDDGTRERGAAPFANRGTPGIAVGTTWNTADVWLRREAALPADATELSSLQLLLFHDEDVEVYLDGVLAARAGGFVTGYEPVEILPDAARVLRPGAKVVIAVHCHQTTGGQGIDVGLARVPPGYAAELAAARRRQRYRGYAMSHRGDPEAGRRLFADEWRLACTRCHTADGTAARAGPDLLTVGDKFPRAELIDAVLSPSASVAVGYSTTVIRTKAGQTYEGT